MVKTKVIKISLEAFEILQAIKDQTGASITFSASQAILNNQLPTLNQQKNEQGKQPTWKPYP